MLGIRKIRVGLGTRSYDILVGWKTLHGLGRHVRKIYSGDNALIISSPRIFRLYGGKTQKSLTQAGFTRVEKILVPDGEAFKSLTEYSRILSSIVSREHENIERFILVLLGGGVIGDLGGFVAATLYRGLPYVQVPTTLLACVDSGVGGKVGVNFSSQRKIVKNLIGTFYQPRLVCADLSLLKSLPRRELLSGLSEVIKYGVIRDPKLFRYLEDHAGDILSLKPEALSFIAARSYAIKADIVEKDEREEKGVRTTLNFGHTIGHALEAAAGLFYTHGEAVAIGMLCASDMAVGMGLFPKAQARRLEALIRAYGLPAEITRGDLDTIMERMMHDKKFIHGRTRLVLPRRIGKVEVREGIDEDVIFNAVSCRLCRHSNNPYGGRQ